MSNISPSSNFSLRRRQPGLVEIASLIDLLPEAALLVEPRAYRVLAANSHAAILTGFTRTELCGFDLRALFTGQDPWPFISEVKSGLQPPPLGLARRSQPAEPVHIDLHPLGPDGKWAALTLKSVRVIQQQKDDQERLIEIIQSVEEMNQAVAKGDLTATLRRFLNTAAALTGGSNLAIYTDGEGEEIFHLVACVGRADGFPDVLPAQEHRSLRAPQLWTMGKRCTLDLHRRARTARYSYVGIAPFGGPKSHKGLIAVSGDVIPAPEPFLSYLQLIASSATAILQQQSRLEELSDQEIASELDRSFQTVIESAVGDGLVILDPDLTIQRINLTASAILGYTNQEVQDRPANHILIGTESIHNALVAALDGLPINLPDDVQLYRRSGEVFLASARVVPVIAGEQLHGIILLIRDQSERARIEAQAQQLEQQALLGEVTAIFAHEVRNPINNISTGLQLMSFGLPPEDPNQEVIGRLEQDCERLAELMRSVLAFSKPAEYRMEPVNLAILINNLMERMRSRMADAHVEPKLQVTKDLPQIQGNPRALEQVFTNLILNAIQAMSEKGGVLTVRARTSTAPAGRRQVEINFVDNGPGIPKEEQDNIFKPYFTTKRGGTGLGLAITKRIITAHKGNVNVSSVPGGTVFQVVLPLESSS